MGHSRKKIKEEFCAVAADGECGCTGPEGNKDYKAECKPDKPWLASYNFTWTDKNKKSRQQSYAPHHILCVASVGKLIVEATGKKADGVVRATAWCVNRSVNMIAMPLWGHTVQWYCDIDEETLKSSLPTAPNFKDLPQHDWDHTGKGCYIQELNKEIVALVKEIKKKGHEAVEGDLRGALDDMSVDYRDRLEERGKRGSPKGTHASWKRGIADPKSDWYLPFSMAVTSAVTRNGFPKLNFTAKVRAKIQWLADQL